mgnify:CR=1 FL=1
MRAVLFDLDGTLADTAPDLGAALNRLLAELGKPTLPLAISRPHTSSGARGMLLAGLGISPENPDYEPLKNRFLDLYAAHVCEHTRLFEGMPEVLEALEARGLPWGVVTNKAERFTHPLLRLLDLDRRSSCIVCGDTTAHPKPHPAPLQRAARQLGLEPETCLYVGDDLRDIQAARAAGMPVVAAAFGYLGEGGNPADWHADAILQHPRDLLRFLEA